MERKDLKKLIDISAGRIPADVVIKNCKVVDVYNGTIIEGDIAISDGLIAGVGEYEGNSVINADGKYGYAYCFWNSCILLLQNKIKRL